MGRTATDFEFSLFNAISDADLKDPHRYAFYLSQAGLGLPDRDYYLKPDFAAQKSAYQNYVIAVLKLLNGLTLKKRLRAFVDFEAQIAEASWTKVEQRDLTAIYNPMTVEELEKWGPGLPGNNFWPAPE